MPLESTPILDALLAGHVIDAAQHAAAKLKLQSTPHSTEPFNDLGAGLYWLMEHEIMSVDQLSDLERDAQQDAAFASNATRQEALDGFAVLLDTVTEAQDKKWRSQFWREVFPGPPWMWLGGAVAVLALGAWYFLTPAVPPACNDAEVQKSLRISLFTTQTKLPRLPTGADQPNLLMSRFEGIQQLGYLKAKRARGCLATLVLEDAKRPFAYTIGPDASGKEMRVQGGDSRVIRARYARADADGNPIDLGAPIGPVQLEAAFMAGVAEVESRIPLLNATNMLRKMNPKNSPVTKVNTVRSVQPLANCQAPVAGQYTCRVLLEYHDPMLQAIRGTDMVVVEGDFNFVQDGAAWRVADDFQQRYLDTTLRGRVGELKGSAVANQLEEIQKNKGK